MYQFPIGCFLHCFRLETKEALKTAVSLGMQGVQLSVSESTPEQRKEFFNLIKDHGLVVSALCGGGSFMNKEKNPETIKICKRYLDYAKDFETNIVTGHIGAIPSDRNHDRYKIMLEACSQVAEYAASIGSCYAIETGPEMSDTLKMFLDDIGSTGFGVNLDPANLAMVVGDDPAAAVYKLDKYIVHTHAKDGLKLRKSNAEMIYGAIPNTETHLGPAYREVPLGQGHVDFPKYLKALDDIGFKGFLTIEREVGDNPAADIAMAADFLRDIIAKN